MTTTLGIIATARADLAGRTKRAIDQLAVDVAPVIAEFALAEIPGFRFRRLEAREIEYAEIDRRDSDIGLFTLSKTRERQRHSQR